MEKMIIPKRYSKGYDLYEEFLDDLEEETELILDVCYEEGNVDYNKLLKLLERYYKDEYYDLKLKINQPGVFFLLDAYIELKMYNKAKELYFKIYDNIDVNHRATIINIAIHYNNSKEKDAKKLMDFIDYLFENEESKIKSYYFYLITFLALGAIEIFMKGLISMAYELGVNEETTPIYSEIKSMCKKANILKEVRTTIRKVKDEENLDVLGDLYRVM